jgi:hypothetical protein
MIKHILTEFIDSLLVFFEEKNIDLYKNFIYTRHEIKNRLTENTLIKIFEPMSFPEFQETYSSQFIYTIPTIPNTSFKEDIINAWNISDDKTKQILWKWLIWVRNSYEKCSQDA